MIFFCPGEIYFISSNLFCRNFCGNIKGYPAGNEGIVRIMPNDGYIYWFILFLGTL